MMPEARLPLLLWLAIAQPLDAQTPLPVDPARSRIGFSVPIAGGLGRLTGSFTDYEVTILHDERDVRRSSVKVTIRAASIDTGSDLRDDRLRGPQFLAADRYPEIVFESGHVRPWGDEYLVVGDLSIRGVTRKIAIPFRILTARAVSGTNRMLGASTRAPLSWQPFAVSSGWKRIAIERLLSDEVTLEIELWARAPLGARAPAGSAGT